MNLKPFLTSLKITISVAVALAMVLGCADSRRNQESIRHLRGKGGGGNGGQTTGGPEKSTPDSDEKEVISSTIEGVLSLEEIEKQINDAIKRDSPTLAFEDIKGQFVLTKIVSDYYNLDGREYRFSLIHDLTQPGQVSISQEDAVSLIQSEKFSDSDKHSMAIEIPLSLSNVEQTEESANTKVAYSVEVSGNSGQYLVVGVAPDAMELVKEGTRNENGIYVGTVPDGLAPGQAASGEVTLRRPDDKSLLVHILLMNEQRTQIRQFILTYKAK